MWVDFVSYVVMSRSSNDAFLFLETRSVRHDERVTQEVWICSVRSDVGITSKLCRGASDTKTFHEYMRLFDFRAICTNTTCWQIRTPKTRSSYWPTTVPYETLVYETSVSISRLTFFQFRYRFGAIRRHWKFYMLRPLKRMTKFHLKRFNHSIIANSVKRWTRQWIMIGGDHF